MKRPWSHISKLALGVVFTLGLFLTSCENAREPMAPNSSVDGLAKKPAAVKSAANGQINILLKTEATDAILADLEKYGTVVEVLDQINAVILRGKGNVLSKVQSLSFVESANPDAERTAPPIDYVAAEDFSDGLSTWNLDVVNVTEPGFDSRQIPQDGTGVFIGVLDTGLLPTWRAYFPEERIAEEFATSFTGGGRAGLNAAEQPNKWEHDVNSHGTHVTSTILGYAFGGISITGVAPMSAVIPVKVLNQNGSGWSSAIAAGIMHIAKLKEDGDLGDSPVIINMSLGGSILDAVEQAAIDHAIDQGVIIVASAGNYGDNDGYTGMGYPGAYEPVISVAASGWKYEWYASNWWYGIDDPDPNNPDNYYITSFSSREYSGQDLDVAAPGSWIVGPYQLNSSANLSYYFLGGTSMAAPHVAGIVALMAEKNNALDASAAEYILEQAAIYLAAGSRTVYLPNGTTDVISWEDDATGHGLITADAALGLTP